MKNTILKKLAIIVTLLNSSLFFAQDYSFKNYDWVEKPVIDVPQKYKDQNEVILNRIRKIKLVAIPNGATQFSLLHDQIFINSNDAIEKNNKIYIPLDQNEQIVSVKARVILTNGKIITLDKGDIKQEKDEEKGITYNYFAVNGLQKGSVIEKLFIFQEAPELKGKTLFLH